MNLGNLEFKPDDFKCGDEWVNPAVAHELANRVLRERLEKTHRVFGIKDPCELAMVFSAQACRNDTHTARLVCLEELPK